MIHEPRVLARARRLLERVRGPHRAPPRRVRRTRSHSCVALGATARLGTTARFAAHAHGEASGSADLKTPTAKGCKSVKPNAAMAVGQFREAKFQSN